MNKIRKIEINPILLEIGENFKAAHTSEPDKAETIALLTAMCWRTSKEPYIMETKNMIEYLDMPEKMAQKLNGFLKTQGNLLMQLDSDKDDYFYGMETEPEMGNPDYEWIVGAVETRMSWDQEEARDDQGDWWWEEIMWPNFTFIEYKEKVYQAINKKKLF